MDYEFAITPVSKPRMTQRDKWFKRECAEKYWAFKAELEKQARRLNFEMPESDYHLIFTLPMPDSWSNKKKNDMNGKPHKQKPDKDNLEKAFLDALCVSDSHIWDGRVSKYWGFEGKIFIRK